LNYRIAVVRVRKTTEATVGLRKTMGAVVGFIRRKE
jgi:hypothetical protein